jgi:Holliday junction resolvasome RuvABC ATP-dependent DNA helicase subunit
MERTISARMQVSTTMPGLDEIVGQKALKDLIGSKVRFAKAGGLAFPHLLLCGEKEQGKITFAAAIAQELGVPFCSSSAGALEKPLDLTGALTNLKPCEIFVIGEIEALRPAFLDCLTLALSSFQMEIKIGERIHSIRLPQFTLIGTTSKPWLVDERLRRWCIACQFAPYTPDEATQIVIRIARDKNIPLDREAASDVAAQYRFKPGEAEIFLQRVASYFPIGIFGVGAQIDREKLRKINQFLGAGDLSPNILAVADQIRSMEGVEFEHWVADLFRRAGFQVEITQASGDHGVDLWATKQNCLVAVQCKRWDGAVGEPVVRDLYGAMTAANAQTGCLVTTGTFTTQAQLFSKGKPLYLVGFDALMEVSRSPESLSRLLE